MSNDPFSNDPANPNSPAGEPANPYAVNSQTGANLDPQLHDPNDVETYRREHLSHEASVKSIGCLYYLGAAFAILCGVVYLIAAVAGGFDDQADFPIVILVMLGIVMLVTGIAQGFIAHGLRTLAPWARIGGIVLSVIGLLGVPLGTIISAYFLYLLISHKGEVVFSEYYQYVIKQTPHIQYKTSIIVKILVGILIAFIGVGIIAAFIA